jgi:putative aldouronate transport system substrate-binding protein
MSWEVKPMSKTKRWITLLSIAAILVTSACSTNSSNNGSNSGQTDNSAPAQQEKSPDPVKIRVFETDNNYTVPTDVKNDPTFRYLMEKTNTDLDWVFLPHGDYANQLRIKFSSGDIPDVVQDWGINLDLLSNDMILPLNDLIDQYGSNLKKNIPQFVWDGVTIDGKIMAIPEGPSGNTPSGRIIFVRKDWMDKAGVKEIPQTPEQFLDMLRAFRDNDLNGNGKKDEIPFAARENFTWMENVFGMFGVNPYTYAEHNGEVLPGYVHPNFKNALAFVKTMVDENLIDSEFLTMKRNVWEQKIHWTVKSFRRKIVK